ncbi:hypothetical protein [Microbacterium sp. NPDC055665]
MTPTSSQTRVPTVVLYDIMSEAATRVRGALVTLTDKHPANADTYLRADIALMDQVAAVDPDDRDNIVRTTETLRAMYDQLSAA